MDHVSPANLLDLIESFGRNLVGLTYPSSHPYDDAERAKPYKRQVQIARVLYGDLMRGVYDDPATTMEARYLQAFTGIESNHLRLIIKALRGHFALSLDAIAALPKGHHWVTYDGDFYSITTGDSLNLPCVQRIANKYLPADKQKLDGSKAIAAVMPNPCTRITHPVQYC